MKRKVIGRTTHFQALEMYCKLIKREITTEEWRNLTEDDLKPITTDIYEDELEMENES